MTAGLATSARDAPSLWQRWAMCLALVGALFGTARSIAPSTPMEPRVSFAAAFVCVGGATLLASWFAPVLRRADIWLLALPPGALAWAASHPESRDIQAFVVLIALLAGGTLLGTIVGARVQAAGHLLFVAIISSAADLFSVYAPLGPTAALIESPATLNVLALPWPLFGTDAVPPILGVGDVVFAALYRSAARAHGLDSTRTRVALAVAFLLALLMLLWAEAPIPALPFLGLTIVIAHGEARRVPEADRKPGWTAAITLLLVLALIAAYRR